MNRNIPFIDCNCMVGERRDRKLGEPSTVEELTTDMVYFGVQKTLVVHGSSRDYHPAEGNKQITRIVDKNSHIYGVWAILPEGTNEIFSGDEFTNNLKKHRISAAIAFPRLHKFSLSDWSIGQTLSSMENNQVPLLIPFTETNWQEVHDICQTRPNLPVIITGSDYRQLRHLMQLWKFNRNLFIDISWFSIANGFEYLEKYGFTSNLLFGTNYPVYTPGAAISMITFADVSEEEKRNIAGLNLKRILDKIGKKPDAQL